MSKRIVVACSGGPDSMALLDKLNKEGHHIVVAHVNYQKRESAIRDENIVKDYCANHNIDVEILYPKYDTNENFQSWARKVRYDFFFKVASKYNADKIYVAHHLDDHIETYLFQIQRNMLCDNYGLVSRTKMKEYEIVRPLLEYTKKELEQCCIDNSIDYGIDESNLTNDYTRNLIRHETIDKLNRESKEALLKEIEIKNQELNDRRSRAKQFIDTWIHDTTNLLKQEDAWFILEYYLSLKTGIHYSKKHMCSLIDQIDTNCLIDLGDYELESFDGKLYLERKYEFENVVLNSIEYKNFGLFEFKENGKMIESIYIEDDDFPLVVRQVKSSDKIQLRYGTKKLSRFFIDRKIPKIYRKRWLVLVNKEEKVIFVPNLGCDVKHFSIQPNLFMVQYLS